MRISLTQLAPKLIDHTHTSECVTVKGNLREWTKAQQNQKYHIKLLLLAKLKEKDIQKKTKNKIKSIILYTFIYIHMLKSLQTSVFFLIFFFFFAD